MHMVDLDGAAKGEPCNLNAIESITAAIEIPVEVGGGIRSLETIEHLLKLGVRRVILGTVAVEDPNLVEKACQMFGEHIVIGIDARDGWVATRGWLQKSTVSSSELAASMIDLGARRFIYTDISRDGTLTSPNFEAVADLLSQVSVPVIAAGGISSVDHLARLATIGVEGAIVGRAIYTGDVKLKEAMDSISQES